MIGLRGRYGRSSGREHVPMDLGISGRKAIVCASSKGLGRACALGAGGGGLRTRRSMAATRDARGDGERHSRPLSASTVHRGRRRSRRSRDPRGASRAPPEADILVNNNGGPPFKTFGAITPRGHPGRRRIEHADADRPRPGAAARHGRAAASAGSSTSPPARCARRSPASTCRRARAPGSPLSSPPRRAPMRSDNVTINSILPGAFDDRPPALGDRARSPRSAACRSRPRAPRPKRAVPPPFRRSGRVRRALRLSGERAGRLHHRAEHPHRRRRVPRGVLSVHGRGLGGHADAQGDRPQDRRDLRVRAHVGADQGRRADLSGLRNRVLPVGVRDGDARRLARLARRVAFGAANGSAARPYWPVARRLVRDLRRLSRSGDPAAGRRHRLHLRHAAHGRSARLDRCSARHVRLARAGAVAFGFVGVLVMLSGHFGAGLGGAGSGIGVRRRSSGRGPARSR